MKTKVIGTLLILACTACEIAPLTPYLQDSYNRMLSNRDIKDLAEDRTDDAIPNFLLTSLINATFFPELHQYFDPQGQKRLLNVITEFYSKFVKRKLNRSNCFVSAGATEALYSTFQALTKRNDEWILIEPFWPKFKAMIEITGGVPRYAILKPFKTNDIVRGNDWKLNREQLSGLFNEKTRGIVLNNPHNPTGKVFDLDDLTFIARLADKYNAIVIADEVFEWTVFGSFPLIKFASLPKMFERTVTIGSASKAFTTSGWRIGWLYGPARYVEKINRVHSSIMVSSPTLPQDAIAYGLETEMRNFDTRRSFFSYNARQLGVKSKLLTNSLVNANFYPYVPDAGDCLITELPIIKTLKWNFADNTSHWDWFTDNVGVLGYPMTDFYGPANKHLGKNCMRFCYQKKYKTLAEAGRRFAKLNNL